MDRLDSALDRFRFMLLAACGATVACTAGQTRDPGDSGNPLDEHLAKDSGHVLPPEREPDPPPVVTPDRCAGPTDVLGSSGTASGIVRCGDGALDRDRALTCGTLVGESVQACEGTEADRACSNHGECSAKPNGFCRHSQGFRMGNSRCDCVYPCSSDADCGEGQACLCPGLVGVDVAQCVPAECLTGEDCPSGECGFSHHNNGCYAELSLRCRADGDACHGTDDCERGSCAALPLSDDAQIDTDWSCRERSCVIGRPLLVAGRARTAGVNVEGSVARGWCDEALGDLPLDPVMAARWLEIAKMEHASVASFARFVQGLMHHGAPSDLVESAWIAASDEVEHARLAFSVASAFAGSRLGPGPLEVEDLETPSLEELGRSTIAEGCVGETLGVAEALAVLEGELHPSLRPIVERLADDEARHAALAWRTLAWLRTRMKACVIDDAFDRGWARVRSEIGETCRSNGDRGRSSWFGLPSAGERSRIHEAAMRRVIEPCRRGSALTS